MQPISGTPPRPPGEGPVTPNVAGEQPLSTQQRTVLERLITRLIALTSQQNAEVWAGVKHDLGVRNDAPLQSRHFPAAEREPGERFGDFVIRRGHVQATTAGNRFHLDLDPARVHPMGAAGGPDGDDADATLYCFAGGLRGTDRAAIETLAAAGPTVLAWTRADAAGSWRAADGYAARLAARGDEAAASEVVRRAGPTGAALSLRHDGAFVVARVSSRSVLLPGLTIAAESVASLEPGL